MKSHKLLQLVLRELKKDGYTAYQGNKGWRVVEEENGEEFWASNYIHKGNKKERKYFLVTVSTYTGGCIVEILDRVECYKFSDGNRYCINDTCGHMLTNDSRCLRCEGIKNGTYIAANT